MPDFSTPPRGTSAAAPAANERSALCDWVDQLPGAALLISPALQLQHHNAAAAHALARSDMLRATSDGRLAATSAAARALLQQAVVMVLQPPHTTQGLALARQGGAPLTLRLDATQRPALALLQWRDPHDTRVDAALLPSLFGLTPSEAAVSAALCEGLAPPDIARRLGVQTNTVSAHIKKVLVKTGTRRQAQLVALLLRSAAAISPPLLPAPAPPAPRAAPCPAPSWAALPA